MSCHGPALQAAPALHAAGCSHSQSLASWAGELQREIPRCPRCGRFVEKANPVCKNQNCGLEGQPQDLADHPLPPGVQLHVNGDGSCYVTTEVELSPTTREILGALKDAGATRTLLTGGAVRDAAMGIQSADQDWEVFGLEHEIILEALSQFGKASLVDPAETVGVIKLTTPDGEEHDFGMPRTDNKQGTGHQGFRKEYDPNLLAVDAAFRRDLAPNALAWDPESGRVLDFFGGLRGLGEGKLRHASRAFTDDPLIRPLRLVRFTAKLGMAPHPATAQLCESLIAEVEYTDTHLRVRAAGSDVWEHTSLNRVWTEWGKLFKTQAVTQPSIALDTLRATGWLKAYPELQAMYNGAPDQDYPTSKPRGRCRNCGKFAPADVDRCPHCDGPDYGFEADPDHPGVPQDETWHPEGNLWTHTKLTTDRAVEVADRIAPGDAKMRQILGLAGMLHDVYKPYVTHQDEEGRWVSPGHCSSKATKVAAQCLQRMGVPPDVAEPVLKLIPEHMIHLNPPTPRAVARLARRLEPANIEMLMALVEADHSARPPSPGGLPPQAQAWLDMASQYGVYEGLPQRIIEGRHIKDLVPRGPAMGLLVDLAADAQAAGEFDDLEGGKAWVKNVVDELQSVAAQVPEDRRKRLTRDAMTIAKELSRDPVQLLAEMSDHRQGWDDVLEEIEAIPESRQAKTLTALVSCLTPRDLQRAHTMAVSLPDPRPYGKSSRTKVLNVLSAQMAQEGMVQEVMDGAQTVKNLSARTEMLQGAAFSALNAGRPRAALRLAQTIQGKAQARALRDLVIELETKGYRNEALAGLRAMTNPHLREQVAERLGVSDVL